MIKKLRRLSSSLLLTLGFANAQNNTPVDDSKFESKIRLSCVGDSITQGVGAKRGQSWPQQAQKILGKKWDVRNFGRSGTTLMKSGDSPYQKCPQFKAALASKPDIVVIMLGTNDTKPQNWKNFEADYEKDYRELISHFSKLESKPRIFLCLPPYIAKEGRWGINNPNTREQFPVVTTLAKELKLGLIDVYSALENHDELIPDTVHPNTGGAAKIAQAVSQALQGQEAKEK